MFAVVIRGRQLASRRIENHNEIIGTDTAELGLGLFLQQVFVDHLAAQQIDLVLPALMLAFERGKIAFETRDLPLVIFLGLQPALAVDRMPQKIPPDRAGNAIQKKGIHNGTKTPTHNHPGTVADPG